MRLVRLKLKNYRCYKDAIDIDIGDLTSVIGKNDVGKSAILESIDAFFNDSIDKGDLSIDAESNSVEISCVFDNIPEEIVLDTSVASSPVDEGILNSDEQLEIRKTINFGARKSIAVHLIANHPSDERVSDLLGMKNTRLKAYAEELGVDLEGVNKRKNPPIRQRIREFIGGGRAETELKVDGSLDAENNLKAIWGSLKKLLPVYSLFKTDKSFDDKDSDIKNPLSAAIEEALALEEIRDKLQEIEDKVKEYSTDVADRTIKKLESYDTSLSEKLKSEFTKDPGYSKVFDLTLLNEKNIPLNKRGSGIRRLVILSFFQAQAERRKIEAAAPAIIYGIEEPETSQHPNHQKMIVSALCELSDQDNTQVLFTTHSANLVREIPPESLRYLSLQEDKVGIDSGFKDGQLDDGVIQDIVETLGILPNPSDQVKVLLFVEGNHDVNALKRYSRILNQEDNEILDLTVSREVGYVITGGSALKHYIEQKHLSGLGKPEVHLYDSDVQEYVDAVAAINAEGNPQKAGFNTGKSELENYLHPDAIQEAYSDSGTDGIEIEEIENDSDVPGLVAKTLYENSGGNWDDLDGHKKRKLSSEKKKLLNTQAVEKMTIERMKATDGYDELRDWLAKIGQMCQ